MAMTDAAAPVIAAAIAGESYTAFNNAGAYIGGGDSTDAFDAADTDLQAATNKLRKAMDATYPQVTTNAIAFRSTFSTSQANFAWEEWGVFNAASGGTMLQRKVESLGTKTSASAWQMTATITVEAA